MTVGTTNKDEFEAIGFYSKAKFDLNRQKFKLPCFIEIKYCLMYITVT